VVTADVAKPREDPASKIVACNGFAAHSWEQVRQVGRPQLRSIPIQILSHTLRRLLVARDVDGGRSEKESLAPPEAEKNQ